MQWMRIKLTERDIAAGELSRIQSAFESIFAAAGNPGDAAMFGRSPFDSVVLGTRDVDDDDEEDSGDLPVFQTLYFSPAAVQIAQAMIAGHGGTPCSQPGRSTLLVGQRDAFRLLKQ